jgi:hypothetical protein
MILKCKHRVPKSDQGAEWLATGGSVMAFNWSRLTMASCELANTFAVRTGVELLE